MCRGGWEGYPQHGRKLRFDWQLLPQFRFQVLGLLDHRITILLEDEVPAIAGCHNTRSGRKIIEHKCQEWRGTA